MTLDTIYNQDCLQGMKQMPDGCVDLCVAAIREGRHFVGFEIEKAYHDTALARIKNEI